MRGDQPPPNQSDDLHQIKERYCGPGTLVPQPFSFTANQGQRFDLTGTAINAIILTAMTGQVNLYFGDNTSQFGKAATLPPVVLSAGIIPQTLIVPVPPGNGYIITLQEGAGSTCSGCITPNYA
jgi:hypothetical protein